MQKLNLKWILPGLLILGGLSLFARQKSLQNRQLMIHDRGTMVMPFDLDKTAHSFIRTETGGVQEVRAKDPLDTTQIVLIRAHLKEEAEKFSRGDFGDPQVLHGEDMPGLKVLASARGKFEVTYQDITDGGRLTYVTTDLQITAALHEWFMVQIMDHREDAMPE